MTATCKLAREYLRVSQDRSGQLRSPDEQHAENAEHASAEGWTLGTPYLENGAVSASKYGRKARPGFDALTADLAAGRFGADVLILWESSRGSRRVGEWATLLDRLEDSGVKVHVTTHGRTYDPASPRDRRTLLEDAVDSEYESGKTAGRVRRAMKANAEQGRPHGRIPYGYTREYDPHTRKLAAQAEQPAEAAVVRELFERLRKGHSLKSITRDFEARGIRTRSGKVIIPQQLRDMALRPLYAGLRVHEPGAHHGRWRKSLEGATEGTWPALVDLETFYAVRERLLDPGRRSSRPGRGLHLLSTIAVCDVCDSRLTITYRKGPREYQCRDRGCVRAPADELDAYAERVMLAYLARPDVIASLRAVPDSGGELTAVRAQLAEVRSELASLRKAGEELRVTVATVLAVEPGLVSKITALETRERELTTPPALAWLIEPGEEVAARWTAAPVSAKREVVRMLCSPAILGQLRLQRSPSPGHAVPAAERVRWDRGGA